MPPGREDKHMRTLPGPKVDHRFAHHIDQRTPVPFDHDLAGHHLLSLDAVAELAEELGTDSISTEDAIKPLVTAVPSFHELGIAAVAGQIRALAENNSWFTLLNIEQSGPHRELVDQIVAGIAEASGIEPRSLGRRMGFVFASSPYSVTPAHFDIEHSLLMQLEGHRTLGFGSFRSAADREHEVQRYWNGASFGRLEVMPEKRTEFELHPGTGAYIPPYTPHWLTNGDSESLSLTVTFFNRSNEEESMVQVLNQRLRRLGVRPRPYGEAPGRDRAKAGLMRCYARARRRLGLQQRSASH